jgi:sugar lactone lactonase YvrE
MTPERLAEGLIFPESPRWHDGRLWLSDLISRQVLTITAEGEVTIRAQFDDNPSGLGFLPGGDALVVLMRTRRVMRMADTGISVHADLSDIPGRRLNDMHTDDLGVCYLDNLQSSSRDESDHRQDSLVRIDQAGRVSLAAAGLTRPNGIAGTADGRHLVVAETSARRLTRFRVADDGSLTDRQVFADVSPAHPDGICLDAEGNVWLGSPDTSEFLRVREDGTVLDRIGVPGEWAVACALGGPDGRTLYLVTARTTREAVLTRGESAGFVSVVTVDVPAAVPNEAASPRTGE